jgi:hypothetical protein
MYPVTLPTLAAKFQLPQATFCNIQLQKFIKKSLLNNAVRVLNTQVMDWMYYLNGMDMILNF